VGAGVLVMGTLVEVVPSGGRYLFASRELAVAFAVEAQSNTDCVCVLHTVPGRGGPSPA